jgi:putative hydrolase
MRGETMKNLGKRSDFHTHTIFSDGELVPTELVRRACNLDFKAIAITDHVDISNIDFVIPRVKSVSEELGRYWDIAVIPGVELTHVPPETIPRLAARARELGAKFIAVHGETIVEPVLSGTNEAACRCGIVDMLAHPGFLDERTAKLARRNDVFLELTSRSGHSLTNGFVARIAVEYEVDLLVNTDTHRPQDMMAQKDAFNVALGAGLTEEKALEIVRDNPEKMLKKIASK